MLGLGHSVSGRRRWRAASVVFVTLLLAPVAAQTAVPAPLPSLVETAVTLAEPAAQALGTAPALAPVNVAGAAGFFADGVAYFIGGAAVAQQRILDPTSQIVAYAPGSGARVVGFLPIPIAWASVAFDGQDAYIFGGTSDGTIPLTTILKYRPGQPTATIVNVTLDVPRARAAAIFDGDVFYLFGGSTFDGALGTTIGDITRFDARDGSVVRVASLPSRIEGATVVQAGDVVVVFGGLVASGSQALSFHGSLVQKISLFWPATGRVQDASHWWPRPSNAPAFHGRVGAAGFADEFGNVYVVGGAHAIVTSKPIPFTGADNGLRLNPCTGKVAYPSLPDVSTQGLGRAHAYAGDGTVYFFGGITSEGNPIPQVSTYRAPLAGADGCQTLGEASHFGASVWMDDGLYVFGGQMDGSPLDTVTRIQAGAKAQVVGRLPSSRDGASAVTDGQAAYVFGGRLAGTSLTDEIIRFEPGSEPQVIARLPEPIYGTSAVAAGGVAYLFGGRTEVGPSDVIVEVDLATGTVSPVASVLPSPRYFMGAARAADMIYLFGGWDGAAGHDDVWRFSTLTREVEVLPTVVPGGPRHGFGAAWDGGSRIHVYGGIGAPPSLAPLGDVWAFDVCDGTFAPRAAMEVARGRFATASDGAGTAFAVGGTSSSSGAFSTGSLLNVAVPLVPQPSACTGLVPVLQGLARASAVYTGQEVLVFGGETGKDGQPPNRPVYSVGADDAPSIVAALPVAMTSTSAVWAGEAAYVFGGWTGAVQLDSIVRYAPGTDPEVVANLPSARDATAAAWDGRYAYVFGGRYQGVEKADIVRFDPQDNSVVTLAARLPSSRAEAAAVVLGEHIYIVGGQDGSSYNTLSDIVRFTPATGQVITMPTHLAPFGRGYPAVVSDGLASIYIFGGHSQGSPTSTTYRYRPCDGTMTLMPPFLPQRERAAGVLRPDREDALVLGGRSQESVTRIHDSILSYPVVPMVPDGCKPVLHVPSGLELEAEGPAGAVGRYSVTAEAAGEPVPVACMPPTGSSFGLGENAVRCTATTAHGFTANASFVVTVQDSTPPALTLPQDMSIEAQGPAGAIVAYEAISVDLVDGRRDPVCDPAPGTLLAFGGHVVQCTAVDLAGNRVEGMFRVDVVDSTPPDLVLPGTVVQEATGPAGAIVVYAAAASDLVSGAWAPDCSWASGSTFPIGTTRVECRAVDGHGNVASAAFHVTIVDTIPPVLALPEAVLLAATTARGTVAVFDAMAWDLVDGSSRPACDPAAGAFVPLGTARVQCRAEDAAGNVAVGEFPLTVAFLWSGLQEPAANAVLPVGEAVNVKFSLVDASAPVRDAAARLFVAPVEPGGQTGAEIPAASALQEGAFFEFKGSGYRYLWSTDGLAAGSWQLRVDLGDGIQRTAVVQLA